MTPQRVCIVGAGISGLVTAKVFLSDGHDVTIFEKIDSLGGVWSPSRRYPGLQLQTVRDCYAFSDFPMPAHYPEFPNGRQIYDYLLAYASHFGVLDRVSLGREVVLIGPRPDRLDGRRVHVRNNADGSTTALDFDFVVVCNGVYSEPSVPNLAGRDAFESTGGIVTHSSQVGDATNFADRAVVVIGMGKSALDLAEASLSSARSTAIVCRRVPWKVPHRIWGRLHIKYLVLSRFTEIWYPNPDMAGWRRLLHTWLHPLVNAYWAMAERIVGRQLGLLSPGLRPDVAFRESATCITLALDNLKSIREGRIALHRGSVVRFTADGLELDDGQRIEAQVVVLATGFRQDFPFLSGADKAALFDSTGALQLYRLLVNPDIPFVAFNGYNGVGSCQLAAEVGAAWLLQFITGRLPLPSRDAMYESIRAEVELRRKLLSVRHGVGFYATPATMGYLDRLLADLGLPPADGHRRFLDWLFTPLDPRDYRDLPRRCEAASLRARPATKPSAARHGA